MRRLPALICMLSLPTILLVGTSYSQDKKDAKKVEQELPKVQLPPGWGKIGITPDQKAKIYDIIRAFKAKTDPLQEKIDKLNEEKLAEAYKLLNVDQKKALVDNAVKAAEKGKDKDKQTDKDKAKAADKDKANRGIDMDKDKKLQRS